jgi:hypothetical protein
MGRKNKRGSKMYRIKNYSLMLFILFNINLLKAEKRNAPSKFVGIFDTNKTKEVSKVKKYTGNWEEMRFFYGEYYYFRGYYRNGIPAKTWYMTYPFGGTKITTNYSNNNYLQLNYYPDGLVYMQVLGKVEQTENSFIHKSQKVIVYAPNGEKIIKEHLQRKGWCWSGNSEVNYVKNRDYVEQGRHVEIISFLSNNNKIIIALYMYSQNCFIAKRIFEYKLDTTTGTISYVQDNIFGDNIEANIKFDYKLISKQHKNIKTQIEFYIKEKKYNVILDDDLYKK